MTLQTIIEEASKLSLAEQEELIEQLVCKMGAGAVALTPAQAEDLRKRDEEIRAGKAKFVDGEEVFKKLRRRA